MLDKFTKKLAEFRQSAKLIIRGYKLLGSIGHGRTLAYRAMNSVLWALSPLVGLYFSGQLIDQLTGDRNWQRMAWMAGLAVVLELVLFTAQGLCKRRWQALENTAWQDLENLFARKLLEMDYQDVEDPRVQEQLDKIKQLHNWNGRGLYRLMVAVDGVAEGLAAMAGSWLLAFGLFAAPASGAGGAAGFLASGWGVALIALIIVGSLGVLGICTKRESSVWSGMADEMTLGNRLFFYYHLELPNDHHSGKDIRLYHESAALEVEMGEYFKLVSGQMSRLSPTLGRVSAVQSAMPYLLSAASYLVVTAKAWSGAIGLGGLVQYVGAVSRFAHGLQKMLTSVIWVIGNTEHLALTFDFLDRPNVKYQGKIPTEKRDDNDYLVEFHDVSFKYPGRSNWALRHLDLTLRIGERLAVVGRNGSGKTTMIKLLCRLYDPTEGEITLNGIDIRKYDYDEYLALFSVVFQDFHLFSFPLGQAVAAKVDYDKQKALRALERAGLEERLRSLPQGLDTYLEKDFDESGVEFSGGEAQKAAIARALYKDAPFLVLDEPTAALDPLAEYQVYRRFANLAGEKTAVCISHRLSSCRFCDRIAVFSGGRLVQLGSHDQLVDDSNGEYHRLWYAQAVYYENEGDSREISQPQG